MVDVGIKGRESLAWFHGVTSCQSMSNTSIAQKRRFVKWHGAEKLAKTKTRVSKGSWLSWRERTYDIILNFNANRDDIIESLG